MKKPEIYFYLSIAAFVLTFTGWGVILSIVLLILIKSEKDLILATQKVELATEDLEKLKTARKLSVINIILNAVILVGLVLFMFFVFFLGISIHP